jgi:hypothetical protein
MIALFLLSGAVLLPMQSPGEPASNAPAPLSAPPALPGPLPAAEPPIPDAPPVPVVPPDAQAAPAAPDAAPRASASPSAAGDNSALEDPGLARPNPGLFRPQPWAVMLSVAGNLWSLSAAVPVLLCGSGVMLLGAALVGTTPADAPPETLAAVGGVLAVLAAPVLLLGVTGLASWGMSTLLAVLGLALPPSMDVANNRSNASFLRKLASSTSVTPLENLVTGRWLGGADEGPVPLRVLGSLLAMGLGVATLGVHLVLVAVLAVAVAVSAAAAAVLAVALLIASAKSGGSRGGSGSADLPDPAPAPADPSPSRGTLYVYLSPPWVPWWWLFYQPMYDPMPPLVDAPPPAQDPAAPPGEERQLARLLAAAACAGCLLMPVDVGIRLFFRGVGALTGLQDPDEDESLDAPLDP